jgi:putative transposase
MEKKEFYHHILPHFQQPGQAYFITWNLRNAIPPKALIRYTQKLELIKSRMDELLSRNTELKLKRSLDSCIDSTIESNSSIKSPYFYQMETLKLEYYAVRKKYLKAYDDLLDTQINPLINLTKPENLEIIFKTLQFWEGKKLKNIAFCIMPNHVHWLVELMEKDNLGQSVYLQDVLKSVKQFSSNAIKKVEQRSGTLWQKESFDTTIRDEKHLYYAKRYTINNPVKAGYVSEWRNWKGTWCDCSDT